MMKKTNDRPFWTIVKKVMLVSIEIVSCYQRFENNFVWTPLRVWKEVFHCQMFRFA